jgi:lipoprotein-releasing system ATP-binding protein
LINREVRGVSALDSAIKEQFLLAREVVRNYATTEGTLEVLRGVDLVADRGDMIAVVGASGVGKSTLLHILGGLDRPTSGEVEFKGNNINRMSESDLAEFRNSHIGFVFQHHYLLEDFTARENVMMPALVAGESRSVAAQRAEQLLADVGLQDRQNHLPRQLSGGELQRTAVARALINEPELVMADEPSGNLDIETGEKLHALIADLNKAHGISFVIATHNYELAKSCNKIVKLDKGVAQKVASE